MDAIENAKLHVLKPIVDKGYQAFIAGGAIRAHILHENFHDVDICTNAPEDALSNLFSELVDTSKNLNLKVFVINSNGYKYELARFRGNEVYTNHRSPDSVTFDCSLEDDAARRDFTINAMYMSESDEIIDLFGGQKDLENKLVRAVGDPEKRFEEDCLRLLRAVRFAARYGFQIESNTANAIKQHAEDLTQLPVERITAEIEKMMELGGSRFSVALKLMHDLDILKVILPEIDTLSGMPHDIDAHPEGDVFEHTLGAVKCCASTNPLILWSVMLHDCGKAVTYLYRWKEKQNRFRHTYYGHDIAGIEIIEKLGARLRLPSKTIDVAKYCAKEHMRFFKLEQMKPSKRMMVFENPYFEYLVEVAFCDHGSRGTEIDDFIKDKMKFIEKFKQVIALTSWINGNIVMEQCNLCPGRLVGKVLALTKKFIVETKCEDRDVIIERMKQFANNAKSDPNFANSKMCFL